MSDDSDGHVQAGRWLKVPEAASHFGKSTKTIERWAEAGKLRKHPTARPVLVWVPGLDGGESVSDMSDDTVGPEEHTVALAERMSEAVGRQLVPILAVLERTEERARTLERENGTLTERVAGLERELGTAREMSDTHRQRLTAELDAARAALDDLKIGRLAELERENGRLSERLALIAPSDSPVARNLTAQSLDPAAEPSGVVWWRSARWIIVLAAIAVAVVAVIILLVWPR